MPDLVVRHIDSVMAERIKALAKDRHWSINDVVLQALRRGLGLSESNHPFAENLLDADSVVLSGHWDADERAAFHDALQALSVAPVNSLVALAREEDPFDEANRSRDQGAG